MIMLTRLSGSVFALNPDLIERIDSAPDTVITLVDGKKYVVSDHLGDVCHAIREFRSEIVSRSSFLCEPGSEHGPSRGLARVHHLQGGL